MIPKGTTPRVTRRRTLGAMLATGGAAVLPVGLVGANSAASASLPSFRKDRDRDDTAALWRALDAGYRDIHLPARRGSASGEYRFLMDARRGGPTLPGGVRISGDGNDTVVRPTIPTSGCLFEALSRGPSDFVDGLQFENFRALGWVEDAGFSEHTHLFRLSGVRKVLFRNLAIEGFQGDGIYLGSGLKLGDERHNEDVQIDGCRFDGLNGNNRNAISVIDCTRFALLDSSARRVSRAGDGTAKRAQTSAQRMNPRFGLQMPGAIDFEPDKAGRFSRIGQVAIDGWRVSQCGGAAVAMNLRDNAGLAQPHYDFSIARLVASDCAIGVAMSGYQGNAAMTAREPYGISVAMECDRVARPYTLEGMKGVALRGTFTDSGTASLGLGGRPNADVAITGDYLRCGGADAPNPGVCVRIAASTQNVSLDGSRFTGCGTGTQGATRLIYVTAGEQRGLSATGIEASSIKSPPFSAARVVSVAAGSGVRLTGRTELAVARADWPAARDDVARN